MPDANAIGDTGADDASVIESRDETDAAVPADADPANSAIAASLDGLRWELPCESELNEAVCTTPPSRSVSTMLHASPSEQFAVTLRFRGVVELKSYDGGSSPGGFWQIGGQPHDDTINVYGLTISSPPQTFFLNRVTVDAFACFAIDYEETVMLDGDAEVTLDALSMDGREVRNLDAEHAPIVMPGVAPSPAAFDGQFIQMDVVAIHRVR